MRILFLLTQDLESPSGLGRYQPLARELAHLGHQVKISALHPDYPSLKQTKFDLDGVQVEYVAPMHIQKRGSQKRYYSTLRLLMTAMRAGWELTLTALGTPADIVVVGKPHPMNSIAGLAAKNLQRKLLFLDCDDYEAGSGRFGSDWQRNGVAYFERAMPHHSRMVTTNTEFMRQKLLTWGVPDERIYYLPNGVDRQRFGDRNLERVQALRDGLGLSGKEVVVFIGSMSLPSHPVDLLLQAFQWVLQQHSETTLVMVGGGEDLEPLKQMAQKMGISQQVCFTGRISPQEIPDYYRLGQVSVDPVFDNDAARGRSPLKLFESWACGIPFITAEVGDRVTLIGESGAGLLVKPGDPQALAQAIMRVLSSEELADSMRQHGLECVQQYYWDRLAQGLDKVYGRFVR